MTPEDFVEEVRALTDEYRSDSDFDLADFFDGVVQALEKVKLAK